MSFDILLLYLAIHVGLTFLIMFFTAKWTEAGKQSAIIDRIEELTKKIKGVETELHLHTIAKQSLHELAKESALQTFELLSIWNSYLEGEMIKMKDYSINNEQFDALIDAADQKYERFIGSLSKTAIYLRKTPVLDSFTSVIDPLQELQHLNFRFLYNLVYYYPDIEERKKLIKEALKKGNLREANEQEEILKQRQQEHEKDWQEDLNKINNLREKTIPDALANLREVLYELVSDPTYPISKRAS